MVKNRAGSEGYLFFPDVDNKAMQTRRMRKEKKENKAKQGWQTKTGCQVDSFLASCRSIERRTEKKA